VEHRDFVEQISSQSEALRAAAVKAGPDAVVPTCPEWTIYTLVGHVARVHSWAEIALRTAPDAERPKPETQPEDWDELLTWSDERVRVLVERLNTTDPDAPAWTFLPDKTAGFWARRQAHETAIHRLDAEHALGGPVPTLLFDSEFAADGVDEYLVGTLPHIARRRPIERSGRMLFHAADAGRAWEVRLEAGQPVTVGPVSDSATDEDTTVAGTADALYRAVWGRPSTAVITGEPDLVRALPRP
jgi:uncharacterized protein (TIGR03083 family)